LRTKDGEDRTIIFTGVPLTDAHGQPGGLLSVGRDITDQRRAESARDEALESTRQALSPGARASLSLLRIDEAIA
jgi:hypothetical protein